MIDRLTTCEEKVLANWQGG